MASTISQLGNTLKSGARSSKYRVSFAYPSSFNGETSLEDVDILAKTAIAPSKEIGVIEVYNQGRKLPIPGDTVFDNAWTVTFYLTEDHQLRYDMIKWLDSCDLFQKNIHTGNPLEVMSDLRLEQLDSAGEITAAYTLHNSWVSSVGEVSYGDEQQDEIGEFDVVFTYSDWVTGTEEYSTYKSKNATENATTFEV